MLHGVHRLRLHLKGIVHLVGGVAHSRIHIRCGVIDKFGKAGLRCLAVIGGVDHREDGEGIPGAVCIVQGNHIALFVALVWLQLTFVVHLTCKQNVFTGGKLLQDRFRVALPFHHLQIVQNEIIRSIDYGKGILFLVHRLGPVFSVIPAGVPRFVPDGILRPLVLLRPGIDVAPDRAALHKALLRLHIGNQCIAHRILTIQRTEGIDSPIAGVGHHKVRFDKTGQVFIHIKAVRQREHTVHEHQRKTHGKNHQHSAALVVPHIGQSHPPELPAAGGTLRLFGSLAVSFGISNRLHRRNLCGKPGGLTHA